eukprot:GHVP01034561.1.p1 GENE.GHVP01034561.1~~GHVP01034561.1.p1  ORF type:complete len:132 (-),score=12.45 GHVP01034561.1:84-479(-)
MRPREVEVSYQMHPCKIHFLGYTNVDMKTFEAKLRNLSKHFTRKNYDLLHWNCNNFSNYLCEILVSTPIPKYILRLPEDIGSTIGGKLILNVVRKLGTGPPVDYNHPAHPKQLLSKSLIVEPVSPLVSGVK